MRDADLAEPHVDSKAEAQVPPRRGSGGRPTREEAARREARIVEVATRLFMERGFDATAMDTIAEEAGVGKPTLYARFPDKRALFAAILRRRIEGWLAPLSAAAEGQAGTPARRDPEAVLHDLSRTLLARAQAPGSAALKRCIAAQAMQFPDLTMLAYEEGWLRGVRAVARLLEDFQAQGLVSVPDPETAAELFLDLVLGGCSRLALHGIAADPDALERRRQASVALFLDGVRARTRP